MTAVLVPAATEAEWLAERRKGVTASEIAVVMGLSPYGSPFELFHRKTGALPPSQPDNDAMALGRHMEGYVAEQFARRHPEFIVDGSGRELFAHRDRPWQMATPDRLIQDEATCGIAERDGVFEIENLAVLECKIDGGSDEWGEDGSDEIPVHYRCQVLWQMDVMGVTTGYVACLLWQRRQVRVYELTMDAAAEADLKIMRDTAQCFLDDIRDGIVPEPDWRPATSDALKRLHPSVEDRDVHIGRQLEISYRAAVRRYADAERRKDEMTNRMRQAIGNGRRAVAASTTGPDGERVVIATRQVYDVKEHVRRACTVNKLVPVKAPKERTS